MEAQLHTVEPSIGRRTAADVAHARKLQEFLRREVSAMETYEQVLASVADQGLEPTLDEILGSHAQRVSRLYEAIAGLGGEPAKSSGVRGAFAKAVQAGADALGDRIAIAALARAEARALDLYAVELVGPDPMVSAFVETELLREQHRTHELCRQLQEHLAQPS